MVSGFRPNLTTRFVWASSWTPPPRSSSAAAWPSSSQLNSYDGYSLFGTKTYAAAAEEILAIKTPIRWLKVKVTANGGLVSAPLIGV